MPGKPFQSKLEPFYEFIREGRSKRWSYQKIAEVLTNEKILSVSANAVFSFVKVRAKRRRLYALPLLETRRRPFQPPPQGRVSFSHSPQPKDPMKPSKDPITLRLSTVSSCLSRHAATLASPPRPLHAASG